MPDDARVETPVEEITASISQLRIRDGTPNVIEFKVGIVLSSRSLAFIEYLAACLPTGANVTVRRLIETFEEHAARTEDDDTKPGEGAFHFPGWPAACGKIVETYGMNTRCEDGHVGNTPRGEPCSHIEREADDVPLDPEPMPFEEGDE